MLPFCGLAVLPARRPRCAPGSAGHNGAVFSSLAPARRRLVVGGCAAGLAVLVTVLALLLAGRGAGQGPPRAVPQDQPGPVLLVPGYGGSTSGLAVLADRLRQQGKDAEVVSLPGNAQGDLAAQARVLAAAARAALARTGAPSVDVVGYSAGGVVARLWLSQAGGAPVRRVVTLGSPQHGTQLASLGALVAGQCPLACQQLDAGQRPADPAECRLRAARCRRAGLRLAVDQPRRGGDPAGVGGARRRAQHRDPERLPGVGGQPFRAAERPAGGGDGGSPSCGPPRRCG